MLITGRLVGATMEYAFHIFSTHAFTRSLTIIATNLLIYDIPRSNGERNNRMSC